MIILKINNIVDNLILKHNTNNPFKIADAENIIFRYAHDVTDDFKGIFLSIEENKIIILNGSLKYEQERYFYMAHELFHAIYHDEIASLYRNTNFENWRFEKQANEFATYLTLAGKVINEEMTTYEVLKSNYIPIEMNKFLGGNCL